MSVCIHYPHSTVWWIKHTLGVMCPSQGKAPLMLEQAVQGIWYTLLICDSFVKDYLYLLLKLSPQLFFLSMTKHLEVAGGDFQDLVFAACRVKALSSWTVVLICLSFPSPLHFVFPKLWVPCFWCTYSSLLLLLALSDIFLPMHLTVLWSALTSALHSSQFGNEQTLEIYVPKFIQ